MLQQNCDFVFWQLIWTLYIIILIIQQNSDLYPAKILDLCTWKEKFYWKI